MNSRLLIALATVFAAALAPQAQAAGLQPLDAQLSAVHGQFGEQQLASLVGGKALEQLASHPEVAMQDSTQTLLRTLAERQANEYTVKPLLSAAQVPASLSVAAATAAVMPLFALPMLALLPSKDLLNSLQQMGKAQPAKS